MPNWSTSGGSGWVNSRGTRRLRQGLRLAAGLPVAVVLLAALGCQDGASAWHERAYDRYLTRLSRVLDTSVVPAPAAALPAYPARRALSLPLTERRVDWVDFLALHRCDLGALVGFRNSPLGRLQEPSQRLGYELALLERARGCELPERVAADELSLAELLAEKRAARPALYWNATFAGPEWRDPLVSAGPVSQANLARRFGAFLDHWQAVLAGRFELARFEADLSALRGLRWLPAARTRWQTQRRALAGAAAALGESGGRLCRNGQPTVASARAVNVLEKVYLADLQPRLAQGLARDGAVVRVLHSQVQSYGQSAPQAFKSWFAQVLDPQAPSEWRRTLDASRRHGQAWQALLDACGIEPARALGKH